MLRLLVPRRTEARLKLTLLCLAVASIVYLIRTGSPARSFDVEAPGRSSGESAVTASGSSSVDERVLVRRLPAPPEPAAATPSDDGASVASGPSGVATNARAVDRASLDADRAGRASPLEAVRERMVALERPVGHEIGEGSSLWRVLRRVVRDDAVLLDRLLDQLAASGMRIDTVRPGREVFVDAGVPDGHRLRVDEGDTVYVSRVEGDRVTTAAHRLVSIPLGTTPRQDVATADLPPAAVDTLLASDGPWLPALDAPRPGDRLDVLLVTTRTSDADRATARVAALATAERTIEAASVAPGRTSRDP